MIEVNRRPFITRMTVPAIGAVMTVVTIIFPVTARTCSVHFIGEGVFTVTVITRQLRVTSEQSEISIAGMVETGIGPANRVVAIFAFLSATTLMRVIVDMAAVAVLWRLAEDLGLVTIDACCVFMIAHERVVRGVVIECYSVPA